MSVTVPARRLEENCGSKELWGVHAEQHIHLRTATATWWDVHAEQNIPLRGARKQ